MTDVAAPPTQDPQPPPVAPFATVPRVAPDPISSGVSFRSLPPATLLQVLKICQHYERKCGGMYMTPGSTSSPAARYLFDMSREIQDLIGTLRDRAKQREARIKSLEGLVRDWCEVFGDPSGLATKGAKVAFPYNTPRQVATKLVNQTKEIEALKKQQAAQAAHYENELELLRRAMRDQARATRDQYAMEAATLEKATKAELELVNVSRQQVEAERKHLQESWSQTVEEAVKQRLDRAIADTCADALETKAVAERQVTQADHAVQTMRAELDITVRELADIKQETALQIRQLTKQTQTQKKTIEELKKAVMRDVATMKWDAAAKIKEVEQHHASRFDSSRVEALEAQCEWLAGRVTELQTLLDAAQRALARRSNLWPAAMSRSTLRDVEIPGH